MALFTDGPINTPADLQNYESAILDVASVEGIDVSGKVASAQNEISTELLLFLRRRFQVPDFSWLVTTRRGIGLGDVVVTEPLRQWHAYKTLALVYRDAYNNQLNDRYQGKWQVYEQLAKEGLRNYFQIGVGIAAGPIPRATQPQFSTVVGTGAGGMFYVASTWLGASGEQGSPSETAEINVEAGQQLVVATSGMPANVTGWNVYIGLSPSAIALQNTTPMMVASTWTMTAAPIQGVGPGDGQKPTWFLVDQHIIGRG